MNEPEAFPPRCVVTTAYALLASVPLGIVAAVLAAGGASWV